METLDGNSSLHVGDLKMSHHRISSAHTINILVDVGNLKVNHGRIFLKHTYNENRRLEILEVVSSSSLI